MAASISAGSQGTFRRRSSWSIPKMPPAMRSRMRMPTGLLGMAGLRVGVPREHFDLVKVGRPRRPGKD
jgi:hypothetical protein